MVKQSNSSGRWCALATCASTLSLHCLHVFFSLGPRTGCCGRVCFTFPPPSLEVDLARAGDQQGGMDCTPYAKGSECTAVGCAGQAERPCTTRGKPSKLDRGLTSWQCHNSAVELNATCVYTYYIILYCSNGPKLRICFWKRNKSTRLLRSTRSASFFFGANRHNLPRICIEMFFFGIFTSTFWFFLWM